MPSLYQGSNGSVLANEELGCVRGVGDGAHWCADEHGRFLGIRSDENGEGDQLAPDDFNSIVVEQADLPDVATITGSRM